MGYSVFECLRNNDYRGVSRAKPQILYTLPDNHPANQLIQSFLKEIGQNDSISDFSKALEVVQNLKTFKETDEIKYEILEVQIGPPSLKNRQEFLGFDLAYRKKTSLIADHLLRVWDDSLDLNYLTLELNRLDSSLKKRNWLFSEALILFFSQKLNKNRLFQDFEDATNCLTCMKLFQKMVPGAWDCNSLESYEIVSLFLASQ